MFHYISGADFVCLFGVFLVIQNLKFSNSADLPDDVISKLYLKYREAVEDGQNTESLRRLIDNDKLYEVHVKKLKEVNAFKTHNLMMKEEVKADMGPLIYINNPVESKLPYAYLTLEEFKNALTNRIQIQKDELAAKRQYLLERMNMTQNVSTELVSNKWQKITKLLLNDTAKYYKNILNTKSISKETMTESILSTKSMAKETMKKSILNTKSILKETIRESTQRLLIQNESSSQKTSITGRNTSFDIKLDNATEVAILRDLTTKRPIENDKELRLNVENTEAKTFTQTVLKSTTTQTLENEKKVKVNETSTKYSVTTPSDRIAETSTTSAQSANKRTPKRTKTLNTRKERENLSTKSTKRKRSTLGVRFNIL